MTNRLTTTDGKRVGYVSWDLSDNETSGITVLRVVPADGFFLKSSPADGDVQVQARETGSGDPFVDIAATPIDLSSLTPETPVNFDFKAVVQGSLTDVRRLVMFVGVTTQSAADWDA